MLASPLIAFDLTPFQGYFTHKKQPPPGTLQPPLALPLLLPSAAKRDSAALR